MKKMKRAFTTLACMNATVDEIIAYAQRSGIRGVEIRLDNNQKIVGYGLDEADVLREKFRAADVVLTDLATGVSITDNAERPIMLGKACIDLAAAVNCGAIRVFVGGHQAHFTDVPKEDFDGIVRTFQTLCDYAESKGVKIWAETHSSFSTAASMRRLLDAVQRDSLEILWDVIHSIEFRETPAESIRLLGNKLAHIHLKDGCFSGDRNRTQYHHTKLGDGEMPLDALLQLLSDIDYDGYLSLEWELPWRPELRDCYKDTDATLAAYNKWLDDAEANVFPPFSDARWGTEYPPNRALAEFSKGIYGDSAAIRLSSTNSFGLGKWVCTVPVQGNGTYDFAVSCRTDEPENDVYVVLLQTDATGKWLIREHAANAVRDGEYIHFSDKVTLHPQAANVTLELWLKGYRAEVTWYQPHLVPCAPIGKRVVRAAAAHIAPIGHDFDTNCNRILQAVNNAAQQQPDIIVLGECMYDRGVPGTYDVRAETEKGRMVTLLREKAKQYHCYIIYNFHESENGEYYNTSILLDRDGKTVGKYRKTHLTLGELEAGLTPGREYPVFDTDFGRIGMLICWDHYFPATAEALIANGAEMIFISTAGDATHKSIARAMDGGVYLVIAGMNPAQTAGLPVGPTRIVTPDGTVLVHTNTDLAAAVAEIDLNEKQRMFWLSVGPADGEIHGIYRFEKNPKSFA